VSDFIQRSIPNYTQTLADGIEGGVASELGAGDADDKLLHCQLEAYYGVIDGDDCGPAPEFVGLTQWFNTRDDQPLTLAGLEGKVVLVDFWAYSCINCQRELPHVEAWSKRYGSSGFVAIGVHTPEYAFEHVASNVQAGAERIGITFPIAIDNAFQTWNAYNNHAWPASYLIDATGRIRYVYVGEASYEYEETLIRSLLTEADPGIQLPAVTNLPDLSPKSYEQQSPETYLGAQKRRYYSGAGLYEIGTRTFADSRTLPQYGYLLSGTWTIGPESLTAGPGASITIDYHASHVYLDAAGTGTVTVTAGPDGDPVSIPISGTPNLYEIASQSEAADGILTIEFSPGLEAYSFSFG
jgi:thiol-disulfide isomerase/thioredoxin